MTVTTLLTLAKAQGTRIATAESCTGGLIAAAITEVAGSSAVFDCGFVTYSNEAKIQMLGVCPATLEAYGAVSEEIAREMAEGALGRSQADLTIAVTGIAGPGGSEFKPEGRVCFGLAATSAPTATETVDFGAIGRSEVRAATVSHALSLLVAHLSTTSSTPRWDSPPPINEFAQAMLGEPIRDVAVQADETIVTLVNGTQLTIYNDCTLSAADRDAYRGERITNVTARPDAFTIRLAGAQEIIVGLADQDFRGPEALRLRTGKSKVRVWP